MKKNLLYLLLACFLFTTSARAQPPGNGDQKMQMQQMMKQFLKDTVQLSDVMVDSVMSIRASFQPQMREIFMDQSMSADDKQMKWQGLNTQMVAKYKELGLTDDQIKKIEDHDQRMRERMRNRMNNGN